MSQDVQFSNRKYGLRFNLMIPGWCPRNLSEGNPRRGSLQDLDATSGQIMDAARQRPELAATFTGFRPGVPQLDDADHALPTPPWSRMRAW